MGIKAALIVLLIISPVGAAKAASDARPKESPAKGEKSCLIGQYASEYLEEQHNQAVARAGVHFYMKTSSYLKFSVLKSGSLTVSIAEDTYPGSAFFFMIDSKRYSGQARYQLPLDGRALAALKQDKLIDFTYTGWPDRNEMSRKDVFSGFSTAYEKCLSFLNGRPATEPILFDPKTGLPKNQLH